MGRFWDPEASSQNGNEFPLDKRPNSITAASLNHLHETVQVSFNDGCTYEYPYVYLQHHCTCSTCYHPTSHSTLRHLQDLNPENHVCAVEIIPDRSGVLVRWMDGHENVFTDQWLKDRRFTEENRELRKAVPRDFPTLIGPGDLLPRFEYQDMFDDDGKLLHMLESLSTLGVCLLQNTPRETGQLKKLAHLIGFLRLTHYGHEFTVKSEPNAINLAYTSQRIGFHTDLPYYPYPPGVQMLQCIKQYEEGKGGETQLVDGFRIAKHMSIHHPDEYKILCNTPMEFCDIGKDYTSFYKIHRAPLFICDGSGKLVRIAYSSHVLSSYLPVKLEMVKPLYQALRLFMQLCYSPDHLIQFKLKAGETMVFDNWRILHGREGFDPTKGSRHLQGAYIDWDEIQCRIRTLRNQLIH